MTIEHNKTNGIDKLNKAILKRFNTGVKEYEIKKNNSINKNIYFFLLDQMVSMEYANQEFNIDYKPYLSKLKSNNFNYFKNSKSFSKLTGRTISHIFFLNSEHKFSFLRGKINANDIPLIRILDQYKFKKYYFDNAFVPCDPAFSKYFTQCIKSKISYGDNYKILILDNFVKHNIFFKSFFSYKANIFGLAKKEIKILNSTNTGLSRFKLFFNKNQKLIKDKNNFFFIHNLGPHFPYRDANCKIISRHPNKNKKIENRNMSSSIQCVLNEMVELFNLIKENDNSSHIIIQGDHGFSYYGIGERTALRGQDIFNLVDYGDNKKCTKAHNIIKDNITAIKTSLKCLDLIQSFQ